MNIELKPTRKLITVAFVLHIISLCVAITFFMLQVPLKHFWYGHTLHLEIIETFTFLPPIFVVSHISLV